MSVRPAENEIMVVSRDVIANGPSRGLLEWSSAGLLLDELAAGYDWMPRPEAELSPDRCQPIACAFVVDSAGRYCLLRQGDDPSEALRHRRTLIVGGHVDRADERGGFVQTIAHSLRREVAEEVGIELHECRPRPVGILIDDSSDVSLRHIGVVYRIEADRIVPRDAQEFTIRPEGGGEFVSVARLSEVRHEFDPWSGLIVDYAVSEATKAL